MRRVIARPLNGRVSLRQSLVAADHEARQAMLGLVVRIVDEIKFGLRELDLDELRTLAATWSYLNDGTTPSEAALRHLPHKD
jgi:hypothetical protein